MSGEQRVMATVILFSWFFWGGVILYSKSFAERVDREHAKTMVPSFLEFLSEQPSLIQPMQAAHQDYSRNSMWQITESKLNLKETEGTALTEVQSARWYNLNVVDSVFLESLPRIGPGLAGRICRYRKLLGGFYDVKQLNEVWGIYPDQLKAILPWFHVGKAEVNKLCADSSSWDDLRRHPYIGFEGARQIERYRNQHSLVAVSDLLKAVPITDSLYRSWAPYLRICRTP
tara:strand:- start:3446 stop:4135 length:690 start_codon:yes stop_codon:yes gene_type:complete